jgi:hypothetical protein
MNRVTNKMLVSLHNRYWLAVADRERGDVPGWVMITLMTAALVVVIWTVASTQLSNLLNSAFDKVTGTVK